MLPPFSGEQLCLTIRTENLQARDDREAIETVRPLVESEPVELWHDTRKVHRFETPVTSVLERYRACLAQQEYQGADSVQKPTLYG